MIYFTSTLLNIMVYLITFAVMWHIFSKREADIETEYRLNYARMCTTFIDAMRAVSKALDRDTYTEPEPPTLNEWTATLCKATHCHYFDGFECTRSEVVTDDEQCPCDIDGTTATDTELSERQAE